MESLHRAIEQKRVRLREIMIMAAAIKQRLQEAGFPLETLQASLEAKSIRAPLQVCKGVDGGIALLTMPDGSYFEGLTCWIDSVPLLVAREIAEDWGILAHERRERR